MKVQGQLLALLCVIGMVSGGAAWADEAKIAKVADLIAERDCKYGQANAGEIAQAAEMDAGVLSALVIEMLKTRKLVPMGTNEMTLSGWGECPEL